jgi:hypothetical protein
MDCTNGVIEVRRREQQGNLSVGFAVGGGRERECSGGWLRGCVGARVWWSMVLDGQLVGWEGDEGLLMKE